MTIAALLGYVCDRVLVNALLLEFKAGPKT